MPSYALAETQVSCYCPHRRQEIQCLPYCFHIASLQVLVPETCWPLDVTIPTNLTDTFILSQKTKSSGLSKVGQAACAVAFDSSDSVSLKGPLTFWQIAQEFQHCRFVQQVGVLFSLNFLIFTEAALRSSSCDVCLCIYRYVPFPCIFFKASHWPSDHKSSCRLVCPS